jgi:hypothetical protein
MVMNIIIDEKYPALLTKDTTKFTYYGSIISNGDIIINIPLVVTGSIEVGGSIKAGKRIKAGKSIEAGESIEMYGIKTQHLNILIGNKYKIWIFDTHLKIVCQLKTKKEWIDIYNDKNAEEIVNELGDDGSMFKIRDFIFNLCQ